MQGISRSDKEALGKDTIDDHGIPLVTIFQSNQVINPVPRNQCTFVRTTEQGERACQTK